MEIEQLLSEEQSMKDFTGGEIFTEFWCMCTIKHRTFTGGGLKSTGSVFAKHILGQSTLH